MATRRDVFAELKKTKKLPSPSGTSLRVIQLCHDDSVSIQQIAEVIQVDPALSAALLQYANAFFLASGKQLTSVPKAAVKLGTRTVVNLALGLSLLANHKLGKCKGFEYARFWSISLLQAIAAQNFATAGQQFDPEELFICGLLSRMGQLALASVFPGQYAEVLNEVAELSPGQPSDNLHLKALEKQRFDIDSAELTVELFLNWGLPAHYALASGFHEDPDCLELGTGETRTIAELLHLSRQLAEFCFEPAAGKEQLEPLAAAAEHLPGMTGRFPALFDTIVHQWQEWGDRFEISTHPCRQYLEIVQSDAGLR